MRGAIKYVTGMEKKISIHLKKARSHIGRILSMLENDKPCLDILTQTAAVMGLLRNANRMLLQDSIQRCLKEAGHTKSKARHTELLEEVLELIQVSVKR